jgi:hypothetical protein
MPLFVYFPPPPDKNYYSVAFSTRHCLASFMERLKKITNAALEYPEMSKYVLLVGLPREGYMCRIKY